MILKYLLTFGAQTLHNGTTHRTRAITFAPAIVKANVIQLPGGALFDPYGSYALTKLPDKVKYGLLLVYTTEAALSLQVETICSLIGVKAVLTGQKPNGVSATCTARMIEVNDISQEGYTLHQRRLDITFQPYGVFI
jgi:hypothetical protein